GHFEHEVADEEDARTEGVHGVIDAERRIHRQLREADVDAIQIADDEQDDQQGQQAPASAREHRGGVDGRAHRACQLPQRGFPWGAHRVAGVERRSFRLTTARSCSSSSTRRRSVQPRKASAPAAMTASSQASLGTKACVCQSDSRKCCPAQHTAINASEATAIFDNSLTSTRVSSSRRCRRINRYRMRKFETAMQAVENASPRWPHCSWKVKIQFSSRLRHTASKLTNMGVLRRSMA